MCNAVVLSEKKQKDFHGVIPTSLTQLVQPPSYFLRQYNCKCFHGKLQNVGGSLSARSVSTGHTQRKAGASSSRPAAPFPTPTRCLPSVLPPPLRAGGRGSAQLAAHGGHAQPSAGLSARFRGRIISTASSSVAGERALRRGPPCPTDAAVQPAAAVEEGDARPRAGRRRAEPVDSHRHPAEPSVRQPQLWVRPRLPPGDHVAGEGDLAAHPSLLQQLPLFEEKGKELG